MHQIASKVFVWEVKSIGKCAKSPIKYFYRIFASKIVGKGINKCVHEKVPREYT